MNINKLCIIVIVLLIPFCFTELGLKVYIDSFYFENLLNTGYIQEMLTLSSLILCSAACLENSDWCLLYCFDKDTKHCLLTNLMVSPYHKDSKERSVKCHTYLKKDLAFGSIVKSSKTSSNFIPNGTAEALTKGIYNYLHKQTCAGVISQFNKVFILFDLKESFNIREVRITTQPGTYEPDLPKGMEIKVGKNEPIIDGDFSDFELFATVSQDVKGFETYSFTYAPYVNGQYVSFRVAEGRKSLVLCYVQIFE
ncbi:UNVERIFIED_CONTAM: hypothetical protein RMT77_017464 [Armadillidium vulgare]